MFRTLSDFENQLFYLNLGFTVLFISPVKGFRFELLNHTSNGLIDPEW